MWFDSEKARTFFEENGFVFTFRTFNYPQKSKQLIRTHDNSATFGIRVICNAIVVNLKDVYSTADIEHFAEFSGFEGAEEWADEILRLDKISLPLIGGFKNLGNLCFVARI